MKKRNKYLYITILLMFSLLLTTGCGEKGDKVTMTGTMETESPEVAQTAEEQVVEKTDSSQTEKVNDSEEAEEVIHVSSTEEFLEAIAPGVTIFVEPGYYNMSEYLEEVSMWKGYDWNAEHPYVKLEDCYDGVEVVIKNADDLTIMGDVESLADTEIVVEPRYAAVLTFYNCCNLNLSFLTMGHTETGDCSGNVLNFYGCKNITLSAMDLYGCGVYAIEAAKGTGDLYVYGSTLRDCSDGSLFITEALGDFEFHDCTFTGSYSGGYYETSADCELYFYNCIFGEEETNTWYFWSDIHTIDCNEYFLEDSWWIGYAIVNPESGEMTYLPYETEDETFVNVQIELNEDRTGQVVYSDMTYEVTWGCEDNMVYLQTTEGFNMYMTRYELVEDEISYYWMLLEMNNELIWLY